MFFDDVVIARSLFIFFIDIDINSWKTKSKINAGKGGASAIANGFDFGAAVVTVGGRLTRTGAVTNDITGEIIRFSNGVLKGDKE